MAKIIKKYTPFPKSSDDTKTDRYNYTQNTP